MRPKLWHHVMTALGLMLLLGATVFTAIRWHALPSQLPTHFDAAGLPDAYGDTGTLMMLLVTAWMLYVMTTVLSFFPQTWNVPGVNAKQQNPGALRAMADMLAVMRPILAFIFFWLIVCTVLGRGLGVWFLPVTLGALGLDLVVGVVRAGLVSRNL